MNPEIVFSAIQFIKNVYDSLINYRLETKIFLSNLEKYLILDITFNHIVEINLLRLLEK